MWTRSRACCTCASFRRSRFFLCPPFAAFCRKKTPCSMSWAARLHPCNGFLFHSLLNRTGKKNATRAKFRNSSLTRYLLVGIIRITSAEIYALLFLLRRRSLRLLLSSPENAFLSHQRCLVTIRNGRNGPKSAISCLLTALSGPTTNC